MGGLDVKRVGRSPRGSAPMVWGSLHLVLSAAKRSEEAGSSEGRSSVRRWSVLAWLISTLMVLSELGCGGKFLFSGDGEAARYRHRELGYEIAYPSVLTEPGWAIVTLEQSDLFVRHVDGTSWAIASNCRATQAGVQTLAAELARAIGGVPVGSGQAVTHAGLEGWTQRYRRTESRQTLEIETVTLRGPECTYDWIFLTPRPERLAELEPAFTAWWQSFEPGPGDRPTESNR